MLIGRLLGLSIGWHLLAIRRYLLLILAIGGLLAIDRLAGSWLTIDGLAGGRLAVSGLLWPVTGLWSCLRSILAIGLFLAGWLLWWLIIHLCSLSFRVVIERRW